MPNSNRKDPTNPCAGAFGDACAFTCDDGYASAFDADGSVGQHWCTAALRFSGGACEKVRCAAQLPGLAAVANSTAVGCEIQDGSQRCSLRCAPGWAPRWTSPPGTAAHPRPPTPLWFECDVKRGEWAVTPADDARVPASLRPVKAAVGR